MSTNSVRQDVPNPLIGDYRLCVNMAAWTQQNTSEEINRADLARSKAEGLQGLILRLLRRAENGKDRGSGRDVPQSGPDTE
ncbi:hypothetical protein FQN50_006880 [Emmonsiellopsis sp. PD_5]|nr:hypothetical protein FQN50_006880 [Emmonsiellopsis sp. PD_5]